MITKLSLPCYLYEKSIIDQQIEKLKKSFPKKIFKFFYAMKSNSNHKIIKIIRDQRVGIDAVSIEELKLALKCKIPAGNIIFTPNGADFSEIEFAVNKEIQINLDNLYQIKLFSKFFSDTPLFIRLNPSITDGAYKQIQVGTSRSKFGIATEELKEVIKLVKKRKLKVIGLHIHTGSEVSINSFLQSLDFIISKLPDFPNVNIADLGGGLKVNYQKEDQEIDLKELSDQLIKKIDSQNRELKIYFEPGKYLIANAGKLLTKVTYTKQGENEKFIFVNSGMHHLIRPMMYGAYHQINNITSQEELEQATIVGQLCETDTFGTDRKISKTKAGDIIEICDTGAYGYSMSMNYNLRTKPKEYLKEEDGKILEI